MYGLQLIHLVVNDPCSTFVAIRWRCSKIHIFVHLLRCDERLKNSPPTAIGKHKLSISLTLKNFTLKVTEHPSLAQIRFNSNMMLLPSW